MRNKWKANLGNLQMPTPPRLRKPDIPMWVPILRKIKDKDKSLGGILLIENVSPEGKRILRIKRVGRDSYNESRRWRKNLDEVTIRARLDPDPDPLIVQVIGPEWVARLIEVRNNEVLLDPETLSDPAVSEVEYLLCPFASAPLKGSPPEVEHWSVSIVVRKDWGRVCGGFLSRWLATSL